MFLPLANIRHHKSRSIFCAVGIAIAVCMLVSLTGLSRGTIYEIEERMGSIDAELVVVPAGLSDNVPTLSGMKLSTKIANIIETQYPDTIEKAVPVFICTIKLGGQDQRVTCISPDNWDIFSNKFDSELIEGQLFDKDNKFSNWLAKQKQQQNNSEGDTELKELSPKELSNPEHNGMQLVIDQRLATTGGYKCGQKVHTANHDWTITGISPTGVATRVFMPLATGQELFGMGNINNCTMIFLKLKKLPPGITPSRCAEQIHKKYGEYGVDVMPMSDYSGSLEHKFKIMFVFVDIVNMIAMVIAFLFVTSTLYTMVLQRSREIAILKSCGASAPFIIMQVVSESAIITITGAVLGIIGSFGVQKMVETYKPLLTVQITPVWIFVAITASAGGAMISALYPAWRAIKTDMVEAMRYE